MTVSLKTRFLKGLGFTYQTLLKEKKIINLVLELLNLLLTSLAHAAK